LHGAKALEQFRRCRHLRQFGRKRLGPQLVDQPAPGIAADPLTVAGRRAQTEPRCSDKGVAIEHCWVLLRVADDHKAPTHADYALELWLFCEAGDSEGRLNGNGG
jgi:hypothetical protein